MNPHEPGGAADHVFDVVVIGAGDAGSAAAMCAARCGLRVAVVDIHGAPEIDRTAVSVFAAQGVLISANEVALLDPRTGDDTAALTGRRIVIASGDPDKNGAGLLGVRKLGIRTCPENGRIRTSEGFRTAAPSIYAVGGCTAGCASPGEARMQGELAARAAAQPDAQAPRLLLGDTPIRAFWCGLLSYADGLKLMEDRQEQRRQGAIPDTVLYLEHEPVITYGRATPPEDVRRRPHSLPIVEVSRGGLATYHGPGQLVGYCIADLKEQAGSSAPDLHAFLRKIEGALIRFVGEEFGISAIRREGHTGVWVDSDPPRKIASIGISVRRWVTAHGFALNICPDLDAFGAIVPCGDRTGSMTSAAAEMPRAGRKFEFSGLETLAQRLHVHLCEALR